MAVISVSIITPAYNAEQYIEKTIDSVRAQTHPHWELLVIDDCSSDRTCEIVERIAATDERIKLIKLPTNFGGPAGPRNVGTRESQYDLIAFLDADDLWHPSKLEQQINVGVAVESTFICSSMVDFRDEAEIPTIQQADGQVRTIGFSSQSIRAKIPTSSVLVAKQLALNNRFNEDISYKAVEDYDCWLRILKSGIQCHKIKAPLLFYRKSDNQISGSKYYMAKKVFMVHRNLPNRSILTALLYTCTHVMGGLYTRLIRKGM